MESLETSRLLSGRLLARNSLWNLLGYGLPLGVAVVAIPPLVSALGTERFGFLAIGWALVGYFSLFDLGLGRALTKLVAERLARREVHDLPQLVGTGLIVLLVLGFAAAVAVVVAVPFLVDDVFRPAPGLRREAELSFAILGLTLPAVILSTALSGVLEAHQRFRAINLVRIPAGVFSYLGPLLAVVLQPSLVSATSALLIVRLASCGAYLWACRAVLPSIGAAFDRSLVRPLISFGGWVTVSNVIGPLMVYFDRFVIGALLSLTAVAYYATPYELVTRIWVVPQAVVAVVFPALTMAASADLGRLEALYGRTIDVLIPVLFAPLGAVVLLAPELLTAWLGPDWSAHSAPVLRWLAVGVFVNSIARVPFSLIQGIGRPDLTARLHLAELPLYLLLLVGLLHAGGITGAAAAWTLRIVLDTAALFWLAHRVAPGLRRVGGQAVGRTTAAAAGMGLLALPSDPLMKALLVVGLSGLAGWAGLRVLRSATRDVRGARVAPAEARDGS